MWGTIGEALGDDEWGHGAGISAPMLQQMGGHYPATSRAVDSGSIGGSLQLSEREKDESEKNWQMNRR